jgi:hypothetical protein
MERRFAIAVDLLLNGLLRRPGEESIPRMHPAWICCDPVPPRGNGFQPRTENYPFRASGRLPWLSLILR